MPTSYVTEIRRLAKVDTPAERPTVHDWHNLERRLGYELPNDFKDLVGIVGTGRFGAGLYLRNPSASSKYIQFSVDALKEYRSNIPGFSPCEFTRFSRKNALWFREAVGPVMKDARISLYPQANGFLRIGSAGNRMDLLLSPDSPSGSPYRLIWLDQDYYAEGVHRLEGMTVSRFLHDFYLGLIPDDWARVDRELVWRRNEPFFLPPGRFHLEGYG